MTCETTQAEKTTTPEEVALDVEMVRRGMTNSPSDSDVDAGLAALSRVAAQASMSQHLAAIAARREEQARQAESERDAARQEAASNANGWRVVGARRDALETEVASLRERVATLEAKSAKAEEAFRRLAAAMDGEPLEGGPSSALERTASRLSTAEARVRELEADNAAWGRAVREHVNEDTTAAAIRLADMLKDPHPGTPLLARMQVLEEENARLRDLNTGYDKMTDTLMTLAGVESKPAPTTGADPARVSRVDWAIDGRAVRTHLPVSAATPPPGLLEADGLPCPLCTRDGSACDLCRGAGSVTRAYLAQAGRAAFGAVPVHAGLLEAVGPFVEWVRDVIAQQRGTPHDDATLCGRFEVLCTFGQGRSLLAAYDAAKGGEVREEGDMAGLVDLCSMPSTDTLLRVESEGGDLFVVDGSEVRALHEDAAKYRAAVERLEQAEREPRSMGALYAKAVPGVLLAAGRFFLGRVSTQPFPSGPLDTARLVEVLLAKMDSADEVASVTDDAGTEAHSNAVAIIRSTVESIAQDLGLTLDTPPAGPGGGETKTRAASAGPVQDITFDPPVTEAQADAAMDAVHRARIAPTPTPEVPPLKPETLDEYRARTAVQWLWRWRDDEGNAANVSAEGYHFHGDIEAIASALARALAEAKREATQVACEAIRRFASRLGDDATGLDTDRSLEDLEVALYQHVMDEEDKARAHAAEGMRERAAKEVQDAGDLCEDWHLHLSDVRELEQRIRALPLE
ncbi:hypothetical protein Mx8p75 [Myxococcus phage Mx8]|uniref:p75 n=1 Tax=Myxococcus phage Mx8 TaxID=49964 RepID=Q94MP4_9CAUD|nr:hypothetical protein Mx8p75 [Myxococcus phage Mx8]AAK94410.1 p75 [Myxococcus phage Mx8]